MGKFPEPFRSDIENKGFAEANELIRGAIARL